MSNIKDWLRSADPLDGEPPPSADEVRLMRQMVTAAARDAGPARRWRSSVWIAATAVAVLVCVVSVEQWRRTGAAAASSMQEPPPAAAGTPTERRQLQFATPGGTRLIWVFNPEFDVPEGGRP